MKRKEMREQEIYYCDVCGDECGLPYYGRDDHGYGQCCSEKVRKSERYLDVINTLRRMHGQPEIEITFKKIVEVSKRWVGTGYNIRRAS